MLKVSVGLCNRFRFCRKDHTCLRILKFRVLPSDSIFVTHKVSLVPKEVPLFLALDILCQLKFNVNFDDSLLVSLKEEWSIKLIHKIAHLYVEWPSSVYYTDTELQRIHMHFYHPCTKKILALIRRGATKQFNTTLQNRPIHIKETSDTCQ